MSIPIEIVKGKTWWLTFTPEGEEKLEKLAIEHPDATYNELLDMLRNSKNR